VKIRELFESISDQRIQKEFKAWVKFKGLNTTIKVNSVQVLDRKANVNGQVVITRPWLDEEGELPFKFGHTGQFMVMAEYCKSFKNFPDRVDTRMAESGSKFHYALVISAFFKNFHITSLEGITPHIDGSADFEGLPQVSFSNVHRHIHTLNGQVALSGNYVGPLLGFLKVQGVEQLLAGMVFGTSKGIC